MPQRASGTTTREIVFMAVVVGLVVGALALTAFPSLSVAPVARKAQPEAPAQPAHAAAAPTEARPVSLAAPAAAVAAHHDSEASVEKPKQAKAKSTFVWPPPSLRSSGSANAETDALGRTLDTPAATSTTTPDAVSSDVTTVSGCLEATVDGGEFRLTDIEGADAPKARSWRSGFLKKRTAPVDLVELSDPAGLRKYVGSRVVATGLLTGKEMRVRSLQAAGSPCN